MPLKYLLPKVTIVVPCPNTRQLGEWYATTKSSQKAVVQPSAVFGVTFNDGTKNIRMRAAIVAPATIIVSLPFIPPTRYDVRFALIFESRR
ncbi:MAG: hypothetical protein JRN15_08845 [Nitrososphaerota archaeon]|nr:hypothetical protein [Nitrososphaerota archaeon]